MASCTKSCTSNRRPFLHCDCHVIGVIRHHSTRALPNATVSAATVTIASSWQFAAILREETYSRSPGYVVSVRYHDFADSYDCNIIPNICSRPRASRASQTLCCRITLLMLILFLSIAHNESYPNYTVIHHGGRQPSEQLKILLPVHFLAFTSVRRRRLGTRDSLLQSWRISSTRAFEISCVRNPRSGLFTLFSARANSSCSSL